MSNSLELVKEFHLTYGQPVLPTPKVDDDKVNELRVRLLQEELNELTLALDQRDIVGVLDALTDLQYVLDGAYLSLGYHRLKDQALIEVHRSNLSKLDHNGKPIYREDGKILKGMDYSPPDLKKIIEDMCPQVLNIK